MKWKGKQAPSGLFMYTNHIYERSALMTYHLPKAYLLKTILSEIRSGAGETAQ